jgi:hypothetical protein
MDSGFWCVAQGVHDATLIYLHIDLEGDQRTRLAEQLDLIAANHPPMNVVA